VPNFFAKAEHALDAANRNRSLAVVEGTTEGANVRAGLLGSPEQLMHTQRSSWRTILSLETMLPPLLAEMFAHELSGFGVEDANQYAIPLHFHGAPDPTRGRAVIGGIDFYTAVQMHGAIAELVITERLEWQRQ